MTGHGFNVEIEGTGETLRITCGETILDGATRAGVVLPHDCTLGGCGTCRIKLVRGTVAYAELPFALTPEEADEGYALACQASPTSDLVIQVARAPVEPSEPRRCSVVVRELAEVTPDILHLEVEPEDGPAHFLAGQYMNVRLADGSTRSFSMASAPGGPTLDFLIRRIAGGRFTDRHASGLCPGDTLEVELPLGSFVYRSNDDRPVLMVATGTGIAPIKAMIEAMLDDPDIPPLVLYWGMRTADDLFLRDAAREWAERLPDFHFVPVLSRPGAPASGRRGYVQEAVAADWADLSEHAIYLCGSPRMIADAKRAFLARGASTEHLYAEGFTFAHAELECVRS